MNSFGSYALLLAWMLSLAAIFFGIRAGRTQSPRHFGLAAGATICVCICTLLSLLALGLLFAADDYTNQYVWQYSNKDMPTIYKFTAIWGGMEGSLLLWAGILSISGAVLALRSFSQDRKLMAWVLAWFNTSSAFFLTMVAFATNPFRHIKAPFIPPDGNGLNPLLQNPYMAIHPPMLYCGFTTFAVPYAFCIGALAAGNLSNQWLRLSRTWTLVAWGFLTVGIVLGGHWAYLELGWGGFWAWDPVENASFLPWLTGTAFLHSVMIQERKNMLKMWNVWLVVLTYALTVFGTFLTRSGVVQSVHAFASTDIGWVFLVYLGFIITSGIFLTIRRRKDLSSERKIESIFSREAFFLLNNLVFLSICFATLWGVMFPVLSEAVTGTKQTVSIPFFEAVNIPLFLFLIFLMGVGPLIAWKQANLQSLKRTFLIPFVSSFVIAGILVWAGVTQFYPVLSYSLCWFVTMTVLGEYHRGIKAQRSVVASDSLVEASSKLLRRHRTRYGGYLVHLGVVVATIGITASMAHKVEREFTLAKGESYEIGRFKITLDGLEQAVNQNYESLSATTTVSSLGSGKEIGKLNPELRLYLRNKETTTEVALRMGLREDVYLVLAGTDESGSRAAFKVFINPLQVWLWIGVIIMVCGTAVVLIPSGAGARAAVRVPAREENIADSAL